MNQETMQLFKTLTEMRAAPGFEREIRAFVKQELSSYTNEFVQDRLGGIFGVMRGEEQGPRVMVAGHLDEVGFMVTSITESGALKFHGLGGWSNNVLLAQRVQVVTDDGTVIPGVIGSVPPHLLKDAQKNSVPEMDQMLIDIGADSREHALELGVRPGQQAVLECPFTPMANPKKIMAKAWDNRYGVGLAIELMKELSRDGGAAKLPNVLYSGATVQEEVGLRGAETAARLIQPDIFYALDCSPAADATGDRNAFGRLGQGALLRILDRTMVTHRGLIEFIRDTADTHRIPYQYYVSAGGTDAGSVHKSGIGVPSAVIGVCARYIHTSTAVLHTDDYAAAKELLAKLVQSTDRTTLNTILERA